MNRNDKIAELKAKIDEKLLPLVYDKNVVLCCLSGRQNAGDGLIALGEIEFLNKNNINHKDYYTFEDIDLSNTDTDTVILISGGGGNLSIWLDVYSEYVHIASKYPGNKIVFLPYSETYNIPDKYLSLLDEGRFVHMCRDKVTYELARIRFHKAKVVLCPDMAFYNEILEIKEYPSTNRTLVLERTDIEAVDHKIPNGEIQDWCTMGYDNRQKKLSTQYDTYRNLLKRIFNQFIDYDKVISTRLHGVIFAYLLGLNIEYIDNCYHKTENFINTWGLDIKKYEDKSDN